MGRCVAIPHTTLGMGLDGVPWVLWRLTISITTSAVVKPSFPAIMEFRLYNSKVGPYPV